MIDPKDINIRVIDQRIGAGIGGEVWKDGFGLFFGPFMLAFGKMEERG